MPNIPEQSTDSSVQCSSCIFCLQAPMHPRSTADILASAKPAPPKKSQKPAKVNPLASDTRFTQFSVTATASTSTPSSAPVPFSNISTETGTSGPYVPPSTFKFIPTSTPDTFLTARGAEDGHIVDGGYFEEFNSMSAPSNIQC